MTTKNLEKFFEPSSIALIGATDRSGSIARVLTKNLTKRYNGEIYLVNPNREKIFGLDTLSSVEDIPEPVDLGCIVTPARTVPKIVQSCGKVSIPAVIIISAGFRETGVKGEILEKEIEEKRKEYGISPMTSFAVPTFFNGSKKIFAYFINMYHINIS